MVALHGWIALRTSFGSCRRSGSAAQLPIGDVGWTGEELIAFRVHLPSRITFHNAPRLERGNILAWEQPLRDRLAGRPMRMEARMETQSILYRTLWLFGGTFAAAMGVLALIIWWVGRKPRAAASAKATASHAEAQRRRSAGRAGSPTRQPTSSGRAGKVGAPQASGEERVLGPRD